MKPIKQILTALFLILGLVANAQMVLEYDIVTANTIISLPLSGTVNVSVNWGDGSALETFTSAGDKPHAFAAIGTKTVTITGTLTAYGSYSNTAGNARLTKVLSWDGLGLTSFLRAFSNAVILTQVPTSLPTAIINISGMFFGASVFNQPISGWNTATVTDMSQMFYNASSFNQPIGPWNTSAVTNMSSMFSNASVFNQPIGLWNTAAVVDMSAMFYYAKAFNQPIGLWNTATVINMSDMFNYASAFNQPISGWNTAAVTNMSSMFSNAYVFNQPIGLWNTVAVKNMNNMFWDATAFNQPIGAWNTVAVTDMSYMFSYANVFNQPIGSWNTSAVTNMSYMFWSTRNFAFNQPIGAWNVGAVTAATKMFNGATLCTDNYDNLLNGWSPQAVKKGVSFDGGNSKYSSASAAVRATLINKGWTITDAGMGTTADAKCTLTAIEGEPTGSLATVLYPNPVKDKLSIHFTAPTNEMLTYTVFNTTGLLVLEKEATMNGLGSEIELSNLPQGVYVLKIKTINSTIIHSFVKE